MINFFSIQIGTGMFRFRVDEYQARVRFRFHESIFLWVVSSSLSTEFLYLVKDSKTKFQDNNIEIWH